MGGSAISAGVIAEVVVAARALLRVETGEDLVLSRLASTALLLGEAFLGAAVIVRPFEDVVTSAAGWRRLLVAPVTVISGLTGLPGEGAPFVLAVGAYAVDIDADGVGWVRVLAAGSAGRVAVAYSAGLAVSFEAVPPPIAQGVAMLVAHLFDHRESDVAPPAAVAALWRPYRRMRLGLAVHS
ncbi:hypothetical protein ASE69_04530 [Sphingomonas sp. Leaf208]|jgi:uncharacterized phiE125 gp8 family phage protein|uniref:head-tail connector protein n=1 Tax=Sphingomonas sp. Leaf208 TaxID=1735679 RepID=UPI0006F4183A|nr:hypothetical protein [Sphingomonas sp. Leaf208]KQM53060.1 hypothetical protein ASE69_04530 [Sphingomonas sp. Leaf208]